jgi:tripartite-type tricarboxylate transporter receptor subunit TctC
MFEGRNYRSSLESQIMRILAFLAAALVSMQGLAQTYPARPVRIIVPFAPGGGSDFIARFAAQRLSSTFGSQVIVDNRPGAGGMLGIDLGVKADADGYTLTLIASSYTVNPALYSLKYHPVDDITPVVQISQGPMIVVVSSKLPANTTAELIALAKAKPGSINFASAGQGSITHMAGELLAYMAGIKMNHVPYKGTGPALTDTISGQTDLFVSSTANALPHVKAGRLRALAVTTASRLAAEPNVPTLAESGVPGYDVPIWHGLIGPKGMPRAAVERVNGEINKMMQAKETVDLLQSDGVSPAGGSPEAFRDRIRNEVQLWRKAVADTGVKIQ